MGSTSGATIGVNRVTQNLNSTFSKGLVLLEAMANSDKSCGVTELARQLSLGKSNVHRLLQTLVHHGYVRQEEDTAATP